MNHNDSNKSSQTKSTILLIGGAGYIGTVLSRHLLDAGYRVRVFDRLIYDNQLVIPPFLQHADFEFRYGDLTNSDELSVAVNGVRHVVCLAGLVGDPITRKFSEEADRINDRGYSGLFDLLNGKGLDRVIFVSTCSNYGLIQGDTLAHEDFELRPLSPYAEAKVRAEQRILRLAGRTDYAATVLRFATAFGLSPRMRFDLTVSEFTREIYLDHDLLVYDPDTWRPYCHVQDFSRVIQSVIEAPREAVAFEVFNAGGDINNFTKRMIVEQICKYLPEAKLAFQDHGSDPRNYRVDFRKIRERVGFEPSYTIDDGIRELIGALDQGLFRNIATPSRFFGNYDIDYPLASAARV